MGKTFIWAHRGASGYLPENTLEAFKKAIEMNADGIELDVQLTKDGEIVVCHDETIDRTSDQKGNIKDYNLQKLKTFNFGTVDFPCEIPTLQEVLSLIKPTKLMLNIEFKTGIYTYKGIEEKTLQLVKKYQMEDRVLYSSFNHNSIMKIKELDKSAKTAFLCSDWIIDFANYCKKYEVDFAHPGLYFLLEKDFVAEMAQQNVKMNVWTVNEPEHIKLCYENNIYGIFTNYPDVALELREQRGEI